MNNSSIQLRDLLAEIDSFFECRLSDERENSLRAELARSPFSHPAIDEARAVMGIRRPHVLPKCRRHHLSGFAKFSVAASLALVAAMAFFNLRPADSHACFAYANGLRITDEDAVLELIAQNASEFQEEMGLAQQSVFDDIAPIADFVYEHDYEYSPF
ncbi:MAG: hypothetical protein NC102_07900 [Clostridium sp.]|nr:hypothetical protein [Clostridium sp.]